MVWNKEKKFRAIRKKVRNLKLKELFKEQPTEEHPISFTMEKLDNILDEWAGRERLEDEL